MNTEKSERELSEKVGVRLFGLLFVMLFNIILCLFIGVHNVKAEEIISASYNQSVKEEDTSLGKMKLTYGLGGYIRLTGRLKINVEIENPVKDFEGALEIGYNLSGTLLCSVRKNVNLKKGEPFKTDFYIWLNTLSAEYYNPSSRVSFEITFFTEDDKKEVDIKDNISYENIDVTSDVVIALLDETDSNVSGLSDSGYSVKEVRIKSEDITGDYRSLTMFDVVVIPDNFLIKGDKEVLKIINSYMEHGGRVLERSKTDNLTLSRLYLGREGAGDKNWWIERILGAVIGGRNLNAGKYLILLLVYIIAVCPVAYIIFIRKKKNFIYLIFVLLCSPVFAWLIYAMGAESRFKGLYMNYVSTLDLRGKEQLETVLFSTTSSGKRPYTLEINNGYTVEAVYGSYASVSSEYDFKSELKRKIMMSEKGAEINIGGGAAFETAMFKAAGNPDIDYKSAGKITRENGILKGEFKNPFNVSFERIFAVYDDEITYLGNAGESESVKIDSSGKEIFLNDLSSGLNDSKYMRRIFDFMPSEEEQGIQTLIAETVVKISAKGEKAPYFIGLSKDKIKGEFASDIETAGGYTVILLPAETEKPEGKEIVNSLNRLDIDVVNSYKGFLNNVFLTREEAEFTYKGINGNFDEMNIYAKYNEEPLSCKVSVKNPETGEFDVVFEPDEDYIGKIRENIENNKEKVFFDDKKFKGIGKYIKNGKLTVRYEIDEQEYGELISYTVPVLPKISME